MFNNIEKKSITDRDSILQKQLLLFLFLSPENMKLPLITYKCILNFNLLSCSLKYKKKKQSG